MIYFQGRLKKNYKRDYKQNIKAEPTDNNQEDGKQEQAKEEDVTESS